VRAAIQMVRSWAMSLMLVAVVTSCSFRVVSRRTIS
jgi:hypothetical protein